MQSTGAVSKQEYIEPAVEAVQFGSGAITLSDWYVVNTCGTEYEVRPHFSIGLQCSQKLGCMALPRFLRSIKLSSLKYLYDSASPVGRTVSELPRSAMLVVERQALGAPAKFCRAHPRFSRREYTVSGRVCRISLSKVE